ncbi:nitrogen fixation protein NifX [Nostocaceae cyanobacterium CENA369]|uniref:Nitrogen fixation protein NifX n=1 Tax=Dendronalium phyllosphericum CENA369 TaxID=1725256 RepID=A0A8J7I8Z1_9NOST|nr:nitrogen fixation protein NifX [Dendronalium phyllosphericum]MBH8573782.1 nitrogen fixation protein NifX [Dendronalium phyllosphericum CENA369]
MKIAFTTDDRVHINTHFGGSEEIDVYEISKEGYQFVETLKFNYEIKEENNESKLAPKIEALADCTIIYVFAIGGSAAARLIKKGVTPVKAKSEEEEIADVLHRLVQTLKGNPPPWLRKALQPKTSSFTDDVENEATV